MYMFRYIHVKHVINMLKYTGGNWRGKTLLITVASSCVRNNNFKRYENHNQSIN